MRPGRVPVTHRAREPIASSSRRGAQTKKYHHVAKRQERRKGGREGGRQTGRQAGGRAGGRADRQVGRKRAEQVGYIMD